jgi:hypothetical protein
MSKKQAFKSLLLLWVVPLVGALCACLTQVTLARQLGKTAFGALSAALLRQRFLLAVDACRRAAFCGLTARIQQFLTC